MVGYRAPFQGVVRPASQVAKNPKKIITNMFLVICLIYIVLFLIGMISSTVATLFWFASFVSYVIMFFVPWGLIGLKATLILCWIGFLIVGFVI